MSKLYDKLKEAERMRHPEARAQGSILTDALRRSAEGPVAAPQPPSLSPPQPRARTRAFAGYAVVLVAGIAIGIVGSQITIGSRATDTAPRAKAPSLEGPAVLKLDYRLDLTRTGGAAR